MRDTPSRFTRVLRAVLATGAVVGAIVGVNVAFAAAADDGGADRRRVQPGSSHVAVRDVPTEGARLYVAYGQSNSECCGALPPDDGGSYDPRVMQHFANQTYRMTEPMLGATCHGGCVWSHLGASLVADGVPTVVFATCGVGGHSLKMLSAGTAPFDYLTGTLADMRRVYGRVVDAVLYHQGESDNLNYTPWLNDTERVVLADRYADRLGALADAVHTVGGGTLLYVSRASRCGANGPYPHVREAQRHVAMTHPYARPGPDTDDLVGVYRTADECHFSQAGFAEFARRWRLALDAGE